MAMNKSILVVEDDPGVRDVVTDCLIQGGYTVINCGTGKSAQSAMEAHKIDLAIIDLGLPDMDGLDLTRAFKNKSHIGIIILSGRTDTAKKIAGLDAGADDYLAKPFEPRELLARVRSVLRSKVKEPSNVQVDENTMVYTFDGWKLDTNSWTFMSESGDPIELTRGEFSFLKVFVENPNRVLARQEILDLAYYADDAPVHVRTVDIQIARLRKKIEQHSKSPSLIKTVRKEGYIFTAKVTAG